MKLRINEAPDANGFMTDDELDAYVKDQKAKRDKFYADKDKVLNRGDRIARASTKKSKIEQDKKEKEHAERQSFNNAVDKLCKEISSIASDVIQMYEVIPNAGEYLDILKRDLPKTVSLIWYSSYVKAGITQDIYSDTKPHLTGYSANYYVRFNANGTYKILLSYGSSEFEHDTINAYPRAYSEILSRLSTVKQYFMDAESILDEKLDEFLAEE